MEALMFNEKGKVKGVLLYYRIQDVTETTEPIINALPPFTYSKIKKTGTRVNKKRRKLFES